MRVDGALREWRGARFAELGRGDDASLRYALASTDEGLYLAAEVRDERLVTGQRGDALVLVLAVPEEGGDWIASELSLFPGESGRSKARAQLKVRGKARAEPRIEVVEGPRSEGAGYVVEAFVPWAAVAGAEIWEQGRGALRFVDVDAGPGRPENTLASADGQRPSELPRLLLGTGQSDLLGSFLTAKQLSGVEPRFDFRANVTGDARAERVAVVGDFVVVYGPGYKRGETYGYFALPYGPGGGLKSASMRDLTGDGRAELMVTVRQQNRLGARELWLVLGIEETGIAPLFSVELKKELKGGTVDSSLSLREKGRVPQIEVRAGRAQGLDANTYSEAPAQDAEPILLPWQEVEARRYAFDGERFALVDEERRPVKATVSASDRTAQSTTKAGETLTPSASAQPVDVLRLFKDQQQLPRAAKPSQTLHVNLLGGAAKEQVHVFGKVLAITGEDVAEGRGYLTYGVPIDDARDLVGVRAAELTGDERDELLVTIRQPLTGAEGVVRELLLVLRSDASGRLSRALLAETARRQATRAIENRVKTEGGKLVIEPGKSKGWSSESYPFETGAVGGAQPLLLPWRDRPLAYEARAGTLQPSSAR